MSSRTNPLILLLVALASGVVVWAVETWLTVSGAPVFVPSVLLGATLLVLAVVAIVLGLPVRRYTRALARVHEAARAGEDTVALVRDASAKRVPGERATFALAYAKAVSLAGSMFAGGCGAVALFLGTRTVTGDRMGESIVSLIAAVLLVVAGLLVESWCVLPPHDPGEGEEASDPQMSAA